MNVIVKKQMAIILDFGLSRSGKCLSEVLSSKREITILIIVDDVVFQVRSSADMSDKKGGASDGGLAVQEAKPKLKRPPLYKVVLLNDDFTPMDFVVEILRNFFGMSEEKATQVMLHVHTRGVGVCGVFARDVAETKVQMVNDYSRRHQHPLLCAMEEA